MRLSVPFRRQALVFVAACLAACTSIPPPLDSHMTAGQASDKALVVVSVSSGHPNPGSTLRVFLDAGPFDPDDGLALAALRFSLDTRTYGGSDVLTLESAAMPFEKKVANDFRGRHGHVYVLEVPPGRHRFIHWYANLNTGRVTPHDAAPLEFEVARGEVVYLGCFRDDWDIHEMPLVHVKVPSAALVRVVDASAVDIPIAERKNPAIAGKVRVALLPLGPWGKAVASDAPASAAAGEAPATAR